MIVSHLCWVPKPGHRTSNSDEISDHGGLGFGGHFFLWGEETSPLDRRTFPGPSRKDYPKKHPWQAEVSALKANLNELLGEDSEDQSPPRFQETSNLLFLPTDQEMDLPYPSEDWIIEDIGADLDSGRSSLWSWEVWGVRIPLKYGMELFRFSPEIFRQCFHPGRELSYIRQVARFVHSLLDRQRFIPSLVRGSDGALEARWRPVFDLPRDQDRLEKLVDAAPACFFAVADGEKRPFEDRGSRSLLLGLLQTAVDRQIRERLSEAGWNSDFRTTSRKNQTEGLKWLDKLGEATDPQLDLFPREDRRLVSSYRNWVRTMESGGGSNLRTGFKLIPPGDGEKGEILEAPEGWQLEFFLESVDGETYYLDAGDLWSRAEGELEPLRERYGDPVEIFLRDLGVASDLFHPIESALKEKHPTSCDLSAEEAHRYLKEGYWLLKEAGFLSKVPSWWDPDSMKTDAELELKAAISPSSPVSSGTTGWDSVLDFDWQLAVGEETIPPEEFNSLKSLKSPLVRVRGEWVELEPEVVQKTLDFFSGTEGELTVKETARRVLDESTEAPLPVTDIDVQVGEGEYKKREDWLDQLFFPDELAVETPAGFNGDLWTFQKEGTGWLLSLMKRGLSPCLADDMGLGKTIQFLAALLKFKSDPPAPSLLVCPTSVLGNWRRETERFAPSLNHLLHHGQNRLEGKEFLDAAREADLTITSYGLLRNDFPILSKMDWHIVALDEAQKIKNAGTKTAQRARKLPGEVRVALTGTPIENNLMELWSIMEFLNPGYLGSKTSFRRKYAKPIQQGRSKKKEKVLKKLVDPLILSRNKTDPGILSSLPDKVEKKEYCPLTKEQASLYQAVVEEAEKELEEPEKREGSMKKRGCILSTIGKLKQICNHPAHFLKDDGFEPDRSGKLKRLEEICQTLLEEGYSALLFTQYVEFGEKLRTFLQERFHYRVPFLHGSTSQKRRDDMIEEFQNQNESLPFFLISLRAGGLGINLTQANHVIHIDRWWNPAVESQATDRAHRIGQDRNVTIHKFICSGTYEEEIDEMIEKKKELADRIVDSGEKGLTELSKEEFLDLIELKEEI